MKVPFVDITCKVHLYFFKDLIKYINDSELESGLFLFNSSELFSLFTCFNLFKAFSTFSKDSSGITIAPTELQEFSLSDVENSPDSSI